MLQLPKIQSRNFLNPKWLLAGCFLVALLLMGQTVAVAESVDENHAIDDEGITLPAGEKALDKASTFTCPTSSTGIIYCTYSGLVKQVYVNSGRLLLIYPEADLTATVMQSEVEGSGYETYWGVDVSAFTAFAVRAPAKSVETSDPDEFHSMTQYASKLYSLMLASKLSGTRVGLQLRGGESGYLEIDRAYTLD